MTADDYKFYKKLKAQGKKFTDAELEEVREYESQKFTGPSAKEVQGAKLTNDKDILDLEKRRAGIFGADRTKTWAPEMTPIDTKGFKFNWPAAYETETGKKLTPDMEGAKELDQYIGRKMYDYEQSGNLMKLAMDMHLWNPNQQSWTEFLNKTNNGQRFQEFLSDMQTAQERQAVDKIFEDGSFKNWLTKFFTPVSREYAKRNYKDISTDKIKPDDGYFSSAIYDVIGDGKFNDILSGFKNMPTPLAVDVASQGAMFGPGRLAKNPIIKAAIDNTTAPVVTEAGHAFLNDKDLGSVAKDAVAGVATNFATPLTVGGAVKQVANIGKGGLSEAGMTAQKRINEAANKAAEIERRMKKGDPFFTGQTLASDKAYGISPLEQVDDAATIKYYGNDEIMRQFPPKTKKISNEDTYKAKILSKDEAKRTKNAITPEEYEYWKKNKGFIRGKNPMKLDEKLRKNELKHPERSIVLNRLESAQKKSLKEAGDLSQLTTNQLAQLDAAYRETLLNKLSREIKHLFDDRPSLVSYGTNLLGKPQFGQKVTRPIADFIPFFGDWATYGGDPKTKKLSPVLQAIFDYKKEK